VSRVSAYAPGRVELLGNHTDYNNGVVLAAAIDRGVTVSGEAREDPLVRLTSKTLQRSCAVSLDKLEPQTVELWANYALGVTREMRHAGYEIDGYDADVEGNLALGGGLSSSAAFEVATAYFLAKLHAFTIAPLALAALCRRAENEFVGVASGLLDQITSVFGRAEHVVYLDCENQNVRTIPFPADLSLVIADSGVKHSLLQSNYNQRREECAAAAKALGISSLRAIALDQLEQAGGSIDPVLFRRALHVVGENDRVWRALDCLECGDGAGFGSLMNASHESSRANFENSTAELDLLVSLAREWPGVLGARLTGGGFGGSTVTLARATEAAAVADQLTTKYSAQTGHDAHAFVCRLADGAAIVNHLD
jgi:galactokinase